MPRHRLRPRSEAATVQDVLRYLRSIGAKAIKTAPPGVEAGTPDILACWRGRMLAIEVKRQGGCATPLQQHRLAEWQRAGALVCVADSVATLATTLGENGGVMTNIEWTDVTWNPVIGCRHVAEGCRNCYAEVMSKRLAATGQTGYADVLTPDGRFNGSAATRPDRLAEPLKWRKPRRVFVNSMSDLFHKDVPFDFIAAVYGVMAACPQHTFQVLTKRPERMLEFMEWANADNAAIAHCTLLSGAHVPVKPLANVVATRTPWPLPNVWHGVSIAHQPDADRNIPILLQVPSAVRFVSAEPLIGPVDLRLTGGLDWIIVGGESGPGARACDVDWIRSIVSQCKAAGVPCFVKQLGSNITDMKGFMRTPGRVVSPRWPTSDRKGGDPSEWPEDLRVREWPKAGARDAVAEALRAKPGRTE